MTDKEYVLRVASMRRLDVIKPTRGVPGILVYNRTKKDSRGVYPCIVDALTWADARHQLDTYFQTPQP